MLQSSDRFKLNKILTLDFKSLFKPAYLIFIVLAIAANIFTLPIFFGIEFLFGSIATLLAFATFGIGPGLFCGVCAGLATIFIFHYPVAAVAVCGEAIFITLFWSRWRTNLILAVSVYWLVIGLPSVSVAYSLLIHLDLTTSLLLGVKQASNGILNAIIASLIIGYTPIAKLRDRHGADSLASQRPAFQTIFTLFVAVSIVPAFFIMTIDARHVLNQVETRTQSRLETISTAIALSTERWRESHMNSVTLIAKTSASIGPGNPTLLAQLTKNVRELSEDFRYVMITNRKGKIIAVYPAEDPHGKSIVGRDLSKRPYFSELKKHSNESQISPVFLGNGVVRVPIVTVGSAVVSDSKFNGIAIGTLDLTRLQRILNSIQNNGAYRTTVVDDHGHVVASTVSGVESLSEWATQNAGMEPYNNANFYRRWPADQALSKIERWKKSHLGLKTKLPGPGNWTLYTEVSLAPQQEVIYHQYLRDFLLLLCLFTVILLASLFIANRVAQPLVQLANETTNLPERLQTGRTISWPNSPFAEFNLLIMNFKAMKQALRARFEELETSKTQLRDLAREQAFLAEVSKKLSADIQSRSVLTTLAESVVPEFCEYCFTYVLNEDGSVRPVRVATADPLETEHVQNEFSEVIIDLNKTTGVANVVRTGKPELTLRVDSSLIRERVQGAGPVNKMSTKPAYSYLAVPLKIRERVVACMAWLRFEPSAPFDDHDLEFAQEIAARAATALDNATLFNEAQNINRVKDEFLATLSHELRTPLNVILGHADILRAELEPSAGESTETKNEELKTSVDAIFRNAQAQKQIIADLLDISAIITGKISFNPVQLQMGDVMAQAIDSVKLAAAAKDIHLDLDVQTAGCQIYGDSVRIQQILWNLLSNAVKFTPGKGTIKIRSHTEYAQCVVEISDSGQGIDPAFLPHVFDRFRQEDNSLTRAKGGLGLGLSIVRQLVEMHGGTIRAESGGRNNGSRFIVAIPLSVPREPAQAESVTRPPLSRVSEVLNAQSLPSFEEEKGTMPLTGLKILLIDDELDAREMVSHFLKKAGATVTSCESAAAGLEAYQAYKPDLIISDIGMPEEDGFHFLRQLRLRESEQKKFTPAIALTAYARDEDRKLALSAGYQRHLAKPVSWPLLLDAVRELGPGFLGGPQQVFLCLMH